MLSAYGVVNIFGLLFLYRVMSHIAFNASTYSATEIHMLPDLDF